MADPLRDLCADLHKQWHEKEAEIEWLKAELKEQRQQNEDWQQKLLSADAEIERLKALIEALQAGNREEALALARQCYYEGRYSESAIGREILARPPWLAKEIPGAGAVEPELTDENKKYIDSLTYRELLEQWRFATIGAPWWQGQTGAYWLARIHELRDAPGGEEMHIAVCKSIGLSD